MEINKEELDGLKTDIQIAKIQALDIDDALDGNLTNRNMASFRNTYTICAQDSLDATYPMYVHFNVIDETIKIVSVKVSFWIDQFRAYAQAATEAAAATSGASTASSSGASTASTTEGGGVVSSTNESRDHVHTIRCYDSTETTYPVYIHYGEPSYLLANIADDAYMIGVSNASQTHTHTGGSHTHGMAHTHNIAHTHQIPAHDHDITYGIYEDNTKPTISFSISEDGGIAYSDPYSGFVVDQLAFDITSNITDIGHKILKFTTDLRTRLSVQIEIKVDIKTR
jgi:hypothetical protein